MKENVMNETVTAFLKVDNRFREERESMCSGVQAGALA